MSGSIPSRRILLPLVTVGAILLLVSVVLVGRDVVFVSAEAEAEVLAAAEVGALAILFVPSTAIEPYLAGLLKHPAIAKATVYFPNGAVTVKSRPPAESRLIRRLVPSLGEPLVACRSLAAGAVCLEGDAGYYRARLAALLIPHAILLAASALLLVATVVLASGSTRRQLGELTRIVEGAAGESKYSLRAAEGKGPMGALARAINELLGQMQQRDLMLRRRTTELEAANREVEAFSYSVSHDLRSPLGCVDGFSQALEDDYGDRFDEQGREYVKWIRDAVKRMKNLVDGLLEVSRINRATIQRTRVDLSAFAQSIVSSLRQKEPERLVELRIEPGLIADGDERLLHAVLENLLSNAFKFTRKREDAVIEVGSEIENGRRRYFVRDNGAGFDSTQASRMFTAFERLHSASEFEGTGIGLATVKRIVERHGGAIWAVGEIDRGAVFHFTLGE